MVSHTALVSRHNQRLQRPEIRHSLLLRHLRLLCCLHLPPKRHPGTDTARLLRTLLPVHCRLTLSPRSRISLWSRWLQPAIPALRQSVYQGLWDAAYGDLLHGIRAHRQDERRATGDAADQQSVLSDY